MKQGSHHSFMMAAMLAVILPAWSPRHGWAAEAVPRQPRLFPDYTETVLPPNIAPLNFRVEESGQRYRVEIHSRHGPRIRSDKAGPIVQIPPRAWASLLRANAGGPMYLDVSVQDDLGRWRQFETVTNTIAREEMDQFLVYRLLGPLFNVYENIGIYERDLSSYAERTLLRNSAFGGGCLNCHTFLEHQPEPMVLQIREKSLGHPMLLVRSNQAARVALTAGYPAWHPSGRLLAFSANKLFLFFHTMGETRDVFDVESNLRIYRLDSNMVMHPPVLAQPERQETWPAWSPDGRHLYFCSAPKLPADQFSDVRYDLQRVSYDLESDAWGEVETLVAADQTQMSANQPRVSPDGRWLLFCLSQYGNFPVYQPSSDLYMMDLGTRQMRRLAINSDQVESWPSWSSNGRWLLFSSKRMNRLFSRPYFSYVNENGVVHKPILLPQDNPAFYDSYLKNFNRPEWITRPFPLTPRDLAEALSPGGSVITPKTDPNRQDEDGSSLSGQEDDHSDPYQPGAGKR